MRTARDLVADRVRRRGPLPLSEVLEVALYEPGVGFYETGGSAGRHRGDFVTSPETGPLFGAVVARALDAWWRSMGEPDPYLVVEAGAGRGVLARAVLDAAPACARALRYVLVERSAELRRRHAERKLPLEHPALVLPPVDADTERPVPDAAPGPLCTSLADLPRLPGTPAVVLANELLDNLPFDLAERGPGGWGDVRVGVAVGAEAGQPSPAGPGEPGGPGGRAGSPRPVGPGGRRGPGGDASTASAGPAVPGSAGSAGSAGQLREVVVPLDDSRAALLDRLAPGAAPGARAPLQQEAASWLRAARGTAGRRGRVVVVDYAATTAALAARPQEEWLRTYRGHARGSGPLDDLGHQDVTCEVAVDQLATVHAPDVDVPQHEWLRTWGIDELVAEGQRVWEERAHVADLAAVRARSRVSEARALLDPAGLGGFRVLEWPGA